MRHQTSARGFPLPDIDVTSSVRSLVQSMINNQKFLEEDLCQCGLCIKELEENMKKLELEQSITTEEICKLKAALDLDYSHYREWTSKIMEQIACKNGSAAAVICSIFQSMGKKVVDDFAINILGVVACLGTVQNNDLSRILAEYLGESKMLAIVCKSSAYASELVKYGPDGQVNSAYGLHAVAAKLGLRIYGPNLVIYLDNTRAYTGEICSDSQRKLALPDPILSNGRPPPGYLGYAVNMIDLDITHLHWKTPSGHGLRETLFYDLFGELQVYENWEDMNKASSCITVDAVSLDGGIITKNGDPTAGSWELDIQFPVIRSQNQRHFSAQSIEQVEEKKQKLQETTDMLKRERERHREVMEEFWEKHDRYKKFLNKNGPTLLGHCYRHPGLTPK